MKNVAAILLMSLILWGCGSAPVDSPVSESNKAPVASMATNSDHGIMITIKGSEVRGADFFVKGVTPLNVNNGLVTTQDNILMSVTATTSEGWLHVTAIDTESLEGKYIWIPATQNAPVQATIQQLINKDYQPANGDIIVKFW